MRDLLLNYSEALVDAMNEKRWQDATVLMISQVDYLHRQVAKKAQEIARLNESKDHAAATVLEIAARLSFVIGTDTPDTERRARAVLVQRMESAEVALAELRQAHGQTSDALFAALDVVREHVGRFERWPIALKNAFSMAIIDTRPPTEADIRRTHELAQMYGWERETVTGQLPKDEPNAV